MPINWNVAPYNLVDVYRRFRDVCCLLRQSIDSMIETAVVSETLVNLFQSAWRNIQEDSRLHNLRRENLKSNQ
jgi:hypothetical protein